MSLHKSLLSKSLALFVLMVTLAGCGYQPLHGQRQTTQNTPIQQELSSIWIKEIKDREGQLLHNELLTLFNTKGRPYKAKYKLFVNYEENSSGTGVGKDEFATRANLTAQANFRLDGPLQFSGISSSVVSYNILTSPTGTEFAELDARKRAIKVIARDIHRRIAVHFLTTKTQQKKK